MCPAPSAKTRHRAGAVQKGLRPSWGAEHSDYLPSFINASGLAGCRAQGAETAETRHRAVAIQKGQLGRVSCGEGITDHLSSFIVVCGIGWGCPPQITEIRSRA